MSLSRNRQHALACMAISIIMLLPLSACGQEASNSTDAESVTTVEVDSVFDSFKTTTAVDGDGVQIDYSHADDGYIGIVGSSGKELKVQIARKSTYTYDLGTDGEPDYYPLQQGSGKYTVTVLRNVSADRYVKVYTGSVKAKLVNEFQPFLHANVFVDYSKGSDCVAKAKDLTAGKTSDTDKVSAIYQYLSKNISYDYDAAKKIKSGYVPDPDKTLATGKGICFDYASTAAAMIRSLGIPCKLITGYVAPDDLYHSWNMIYVQSKGWISVEVQADPDEWGRIDITYAATGGDPAFVGDGSNYIERYVY